MKDYYRWIIGVLLGLGILFGARTHFVHKQVVQPAVQKLADAVIETTTTTSTTSTTLPRRRHAKTPHPHEDGFFKRGWNSFKGLFE